MRNNLGFGVVITILLIITVLSLCIAFKYAMVFFGSDDPRPQDMRAMVGGIMVAIICVWFIIGIIDEMKG